MHQVTLYRKLLLAAALLAVVPAWAVPRASSQDDPDQAPVEGHQSAASDQLAEARAAAARGDSAEALARYLRVLATAPDDVTALVGAGTAALAVGDTNAAAGFYARADALNPRDGQAKAGLARTMLQTGNARGALRLFHDAVDLGVPVASIAADRGLAYDLRGSPKRAQADYQLALRTKPDDAETLRRLALSQAIAGDRAAAMATLDPLLRKQSVPAWRARAFVFALTGDAQAAAAGAALVMPSNQVEELRPYLSRLANLKAADKAAAIHLGRFPGEGNKAAQKAAEQSAPRLPIDRAALATTPEASRPAEGAAPAAVVSRGPDPVDARAAARAQAAAKARALAEAKAKEKREEQAEARAAARKNPARHWVQVAGGANKNDLGKAWDKLKAKWPKQLAGHSPWTTHYRYTNRLMIGPFPSSAAAQAWVTKSAKDGFASFRVETKAGVPVERVN